MVVVGQRSKPMF